MMSYIVYAIVYCHPFEGLTPMKNVNYEEDLVQFWYCVLSKNKAPFHI